MELIIDTQNENIRDDFNIDDSKLVTFLMALICGFSFCFLIIHIFLFLLR